MRDLMPRVFYKGGASSGNAKSMDDYYREWDDKVADWLNSLTNEEMSTLDVDDSAVPLTHYSLDYMKKYLKTMLEDAGYELTDDYGTWDVEYSDGTWQTISSHTSKFDNQHIRWRNIIGIMADTPDELSIGGRGYVFYNDVKYEGPGNASYDLGYSRWRVGSARDYPEEAKRQNAWGRRKRKK